MKTDQPPEAGYLQIVSGAVADLKNRLQFDYEQAYPELGEIIHLVLDEEEANAWDLSLFPHLLLPDLVEAHIAKLNLQPAKNKYADLVPPRAFNPTPAYESALAVCGA